MNRAHGEGGPSLRAMLAILVPVVCPQGEKNAYGNEDDLEKQVEERPLFAAEAHGREYLSMEPGARSEAQPRCYRVSGRFKS